jgi:kynureninase
MRIPDKGRAFCEELAGAGVIGDWREPDILRIAPVPLYNSYQDVYEFVRRFSAILLRKG